MSIKINDQDGTTLVLLLDYAETYLESLADQAADDNEPGQVNVYLTWMDAVERIRSQVEPQVEKGSR